MKRQLYLAAYDVACPKRLQRALKTVKAYATGGQKSVFECWLTLSERRALLTSVANVLDEGEDRFFLLRLDARSRFRALGLGVPPSDTTFFYQG